jgi:hypothetical protein
MVSFSNLQYLIVVALALVAFGLEVFALVDAARTRSDAFVAAGKQTKNLWLIILSVAAALGFVALPVPGSGGLLGPLSFLSIVAVVAAAVYLTDVRPAVRQIRGGGGGRNAGPYGPW